MGIIDVILIGMALSVDACAITIANCTAYKDKLNKKLEWSMPVTFALMQGIMPLIGYFIGSTFAQAIGSYSGYIASAVFFALAGKIFFDIISKMIKDKKQVEDKKDQPQKNINFSVIIVQGVATSIDALIVGVTLSLGLTFSIFIAVAIITVITFILVTVSLIFGKSLGKIVGDYAPWVGALLLVGLAIKTLVEAIIG